jgi:hypothetical protein
MKEKEFWNHSHSYSRATTKRLRSGYDKLDTKLAYHVQFDFISSNVFLLSLSVAPLGMVFKVSQREPEVIGTRLRT